MGAITQAKQDKLEKSEGTKTLQTLIKSMEGQIAKALPSVLTPERFSRMVLTAISKDKNLAMCTPNSFLGAIMQAAQLGLEPNTPLGQAYLIPFKNHNRGRLEVQFQIGYKGLIDLAYRSGEITDIQAHEVHENDLFEYELGLDPKLKHVPALTDRGAVTQYYAVFHTKAGGYGFQVMSLEDIRKHAAKYSQAYNSQHSPWKSNFDAMAKKTVLKQALKYAPISTEFVREVATDETIKSQVDGDMLDMEDETIIDITPEPNEHDTTEDNEGTMSL